MANTTSPTTISYIIISIIFLICSNYTTITQLIGPFDLHNFLQIPACYIVLSNIIEYFTTTKHGFIVNIIVLWITVVTWFNVIITNTLLNIIIFTMCLMYKNIFAYFKKSSLYKDFKVIYDRSHFKKMSLRDMLNKLIN